MEKDLYLEEKNKIDKLSLNNSEKEFLKTPKKELHFSIPVSMDSGEKKVFKAYRIQHNNALGPYKGGIRFVKDLDVNTIRALSIWMTWKCAIVNLPLGGAKGGVDCDITKLSKNEQEQICRGYVRSIYNDLGPNTDIPAPDINTNSQHMLYMMDEYEIIMGYKAPGIITGKPIGAGGSLGRDRATGYGLVYVLSSYLLKEGIGLKGSSMSIQGFGEVGKNVAELFSELGGIVKAISFYHLGSKEVYTVFKEEGIDVKELSLILEENHTNIMDIKDSGYKVLDGESWYKQEVDILVPAALENQINDIIIKKISKEVKVICEGANGPTTVDGDREAKKRGITILPDVLCNSGGVTCSYFEQIQNNSNYYWSEEEVFLKLKKLMEDAFEKIYNIAKKDNITMREACFNYSTKKILDTSRIKGWI